MKNIYKGLDLESLSQLLEGDPDPVGLPLSDTDFEHYLYERELPSGLTAGGRIILQVARQTGCDDFKEAIHRVSRALVWKEALRTWFKNGRWYPTEKLLWLVSVMLSPIHPRRHTVEHLLNHIPFKRVLDRWGHLRGLKSSAWAGVFDELRATQTSIYKLPLWMFRFIIKHDELSRFVARPGDHRELYKACMIWSMQAKLYPKSPFMPKRLAVRLWEIYGRTPLEGELRYAVGAWCLIARDSGGDRSEDVNRFWQLHSEAQKLKSEDIIWAQLVISLAQLKYCKRQSFAGYSLLKDLDLEGHLLRMWEDKYSALPVILWSYVHEAMEYAGGRPIACVARDGMWLHAAFQEIGYPSYLLAFSRQQIGDANSLAEVKSLPEDAVILDTQGSGSIYDWLKAQGVTQEMVFGYCTSGNYPSILRGVNRDEIIKGIEGFVSLTCPVERGLTIDDDGNVVWCEKDPKKLASAAVLSSEEKRSLRLALCKRMGISPKWADYTGTTRASRNGICRPGLTLVERPKQTSELPKYFITLANSRKPRRFEPSLDTSVWASLRGIESGYGEYAYLLELDLETSAEVAYWYSGQTPQGTVYGIDMSYGLSGAVSAKSTLIKGVIQLPVDTSKLLLKTADLGILPIKGGYARIEWTRGDASKSLPVSLVKYGEIIRTHTRGIGELLQ